MERKSSSVIGRHIAAARKQAGLTQEELVDPLLVITVHASFEDACRDAKLLEPAQLVMHQRQQWVDDDCHSIKQHGWQHEAQALACACRKYRQEVWPSMALDDVHDDEPLEGPEIVD